MKKQAKKENELMRDLFSRQEVFEPSSSFTERVMYRVSVEKSYYAEIYKPLISRTAWIVIAVLVAALVVVAFVFGGAGTGYAQYLPDINLNWHIDTSKITAVTGQIDRLFQFSSPVAVYILFGLLAMCLILIGESLLPHRIFRKSNPTSPTQ